MLKTKAHSRIDEFTQSFYLPSTDPSEYGSGKEDSAGSQDTSCSTDQGSSLSAVAEISKIRVLDRLMSKLQEWLEVNLQKRGASDSQQTSSQGSAPAATVPSCSSQDSGSQGTKGSRKRNCEKSGEDDDEESVQHRRKRAKTTDTVEAKRKNGKDRQMGEEEKWVDMYKILFPHDGPMPSPFAELCPLQTDQDTERPGANLLDSFENFARREFSTRMRPRMESLVDGVLEQTLTSQAITDVANNVLQDLMQSFRASQGQATCQPEAEGSPSKSPTPQAVLVEDTSHVPQDNDFIENGFYSDLELNLDEILNCLDDSQPWDLDIWQTEVEAENDFQPIGGGGEIICGLLTF
ncbi:hypothetical protein FSARC_50 [Fusarium sarcochroum]|uniref:Uncharacterized protein n=1 Tax=Fusarium sarcochroum TaxID=1208366 RepID=A0A8H4XFY9_9HYPO|nr:hypothetical protein FSARC_50 [Fusarium sarcochroum]